MKSPHVAVVLGSGSSALRVVRLLRDTGHAMRAVAAGNPASDRQPHGDVLVDATDEGEAVPVAALEQALRAGTPVVTANPVVVGTAGRRLQSLAEQQGTPFRAAPALARLVDDTSALLRLAARDRITRIDALLSRRVQELLARMGPGGMSREDAAERVPEGERELDGRSVAARLGCLAGLVWGEHIAAQDVLALGMDWIKRSDVQRGDGHRWQLVATAVQGRCARVEPAALPPGHPLSLTGSAPAVMVTGERAGPVLYEGPADDRAAALALLTEARAVVGAEPIGVPALARTPRRGRSAAAGHRLVREGVAG